MSAPLGPVQSVFQGSQDADGGGEEAAYLVAGQRDQGGSTGCSGGVVFMAVAGRGWGRGGGRHGQEGVGEHGQDGPAAPRGPGADLVLVHGGEFFAAGEGLLDLPADAGDTDQLGEGDRPRCVGAVERVLAVADPAPDQQPVGAGSNGAAGVAAGVAAGQGGVGDLDQGPVIPAGAFGSGTGGQPLPG